YPGKRPLLLLDRPVKELLKNTALTPPLNRLETLASRERALYLARFLVQEGKQNNFHYFLSAPLRTMSK
ncbi:MAG: hypothetical protein LBF16_07720, partial [Pseudomonadales bacterium]|nr:hypothetical protein [Pseudomonadales bacterium]